MALFDESVIEAATLAWLESAGWQVRNGAEIAPGEPAAERDDYGQVVLAQKGTTVVSSLLDSSNYRNPDVEAGRGKVL